MSIPILDSSKNWACPNCPALDRTNEARPHTRMHNCAGMGGLSLPMVEAGRNARVSLREREDYVNGEHGLVYKDGTPIMSAVTEYDDGSNDVAVFAPSVRVEMRV